MKKWRTDELAFILYNNRSVDGVVKNFILEDTNWELLYDVESKIEWLQQIYQEDKYIEVENKYLNQNADDIVYNATDIDLLTDLILEANLNISDLERAWLNNRGINDELITKWKLAGLSYIKDQKALEVLNCTVHPLLSDVLEDGIEGGGILIPLFNREGRLVNCAIRKISDVGKLKYGLACPDISVWNLDCVKSNELFITEGLFDMMALIQEGKEAISVSSAMWSGPQLLKVIEYLPKKITIWADNDKAGLRCAKVLQRFFRMYGIEAVTIHSKLAKDASEHFTKRGLSWDDVEEFDITKDMIDSELESTFDFFKYIKERKF